MGRPRLAAAGSGGKRSQQCSSRTARNSSRANGFRSVPNAQPSIGTIRIQGRRGTGRGTVPASSTDRASLPSAAVSPVRPVRATASRAPRGRPGRRPPRARPGSGSASPPPSLQGSACSRGRARIPRQACSAPTQVNTLEKPSSVAVLLEDDRDGRSLRGKGKGGPGKARAVADAFRDRGLDAKGASRDVLPQ